MRKISLVLLTIISSLATYQCAAQQYTFKKGDSNGTEKWYMGREIAHVMGYQGIHWLERPEREEEENTSILIKNMAIGPDDIIADVGAGSGYHVFKMAAIAESGLVYAVDIQDEMLETIEIRKRKDGINNIELVKGSEKGTNLKHNSVDKVLLVDVYHEFSYPKEMMASIRDAMKDDAELFLIEYRGEDDWIPIKKLHKMTLKQAVKELDVVGLKLERNIDNLPWQHCMIFVRK